jgi:hypothetical protein
MEKMKSPSGLNTFDYFEKPRRVESTAQLRRLMSVDAYCKKHHISRAGAVYRIKKRVIWSTKIGSRVWVDG